MTSSSTPFRDLTSEEILAQKPSKVNATALQNDVNRLRGLVAAGLDQLRNSSRADAIVEEQKAPPLLFWLLSISSGMDGGAHFRDQLAARSTVCGHYFKPKEMVVSCADCAADATCVMCMTCFQDSPCREHHYKIHMSGGGGMCDCGDPTAYKPESFCSRHSGTSDTADPLAHISAADVGWMTEVFDGIVKALALLVVRVDAKRSTADNVKWLLGTIDLAAEYLTGWANAGDAGKRLLSNALLSAITFARTGAKREETTSCLECFFSSCIGNWSVYTKMSAVFAVCLSDPLFRTPFAAMLLKYREYMCGEKDTDFDQENLSVQVFTNADVVRALMTDPATNSAYAPASDTVAHRLVLCIYVLLLSIARPVDENTSHPETVDGIPFQTKTNASDYSHDALNDFQHIIMTSPESALGLFTSRTAYRGLLESFKIMSASSDFAENQPLDEKYVPVPFFLFYVFSRCLLILQRSLRGIITALNSIPPDSGDNFMGELGAALGVSPQLFRTLARSTCFDSTPFLTDETQSVSVRSRIAAFIEATRVQDAKAALLLPESAASGRAAFDFVHSLLDEAIAEMQPLVKQQVEVLTRHNKSLVLSCKEGCRRFCTDVYMYDGGEPCRHRVLMTNVLARWVATVARAWMCSQNGIEPSRLYGADGGADEGSAEQVGATCDGGEAAGTLPKRLFQKEAKRPLLNMVKSSFVHQQSPGFVSFLFDSLVMPSVFCARVLVGLMRAEEGSMFLVERMYLQRRRSCGFANDVYLLQLLTLVMRPQDFAVRLLQRFSFARNPTSESEERKKKKLTKRQRKEKNAKAMGGVAGRVPPGLASFFRLLLTIVLDTSKSSTDDDFSIARLTQEVVMTLATGALPYSGVEGEMSESSSESNRRKEQMDAKLPQVLSDVAVREKTAKGFVFKIKSAKVWEQEVNLYHTSVDDISYNDIFDCYRQIHRAEQHREKAKADPATDMPCVPPPVLRTKGTYAELVPSTRALLHADAVLLPAMFVVHQYVENVKKDASIAAGETNKGRGVVTDSDSDSDEEASTQIPEVLLVHALSALYACAKDCEEIAAQLEEEGKSDNVEEGATQDPPSSNKGVNWDLLDSFFESQHQYECSYTMESYASLLLCPAALAGGTLRSKLARAVELAPGAKAATMCDKLHALRDHVRQRKELNRFSLLPMIEKVLLVTGLAQFQSADFSAAERASEQEAQDHRQKLKEKQEMILKRMRMRTKKTEKEMTAEGDGEEEGNNSASASISTTNFATAIAASTKDANAPGFLHTRMLIELAAQECSVCRVAREEPLFLLANTSTSGVLARLQPGCLPAARKAHGHFYVCGHAAHASCVRKIISSRMRSGYRGRSYLDGAEISCPVCMMVTNALSPLPALTGAKDFGASASLLEDIQNNFKDAAGEAQKEYDDAVETLHVTLANANVGLSLSHGGDAIEQKEDDLQRNHNDAWILSESIRVICTHVDLVMERVKTGRPVHERDLVAELSLLTSFRCDRLRAQADRLRQNYTRSGEVTPLLLLECLLQPAKAAEKIRDAVAQWMRCADPVQACLAALLDRVGGANEGEAEADTESDAGAPDPLVSSLWQQMGVLTLLKVLLCDARAGTVLGLRGDEVCFLPLEEASLGTEAGRACALVRMLYYLTARTATPRSPTLAEMVEAVRQARGGSAPGAPNAPLYARLQLSVAAFVSPSQWRKYLVHTVLHLPEVYTAVLTRHAETETCSVCKKVSKSPFMCCLCGAFLCFGEGELHEHARVCASGSALFLDIHYTVFRIVNAVDEKVTLLMPAYLDVHGETDQMLRRGQRLSLDPDESQQLLYFWLGNRWGVQSQCVKQTVRYLANRI